MPEATYTTANGRRRFDRTLMRSVSALIAVLLIGAVGPAGCSHNPAPNPDDNAPKIDARTRVRVVNQAFQDMTIYVVTESGQNIRLGLASGTTTSIFDIPSSLVSQSMTVLQFLAVPIAGNRAPFTQQLQIDPGDMVQLIVSQY
jgi:hypothetical protein